MYKNAFIVFIPLLMFIFSCNTFDINKKDAVKNKNARQIIDTTFKLDIFTSLPDTLNECNEVLCYDTVKAIKKNYIFVSNNENLGIIKIRGKLIYLNMDSSETISTNVDSFKTVYKGYGWTVIIIVKIQEKEDEMMIEKGTIEIRFDRYRQIITVKGEGEC